MAFRKSRVRISVPPLLCYTVYVIERTLILMQGVPGSGKSTMADLLRRGMWEANEALMVPVLSTDDYWYDEDGNYNYDPSLLETAHRNTMTQALSHMMDEQVDALIIDNTNILRKHVQPYLAFAYLFEYNVQVVRVDPGVEVCVVRQADRPEDRRVPEEVIRRMYSQMENLI